jgi:hypothetical protein
MDVIALRGIHDTGKSETINMIYQNLLRNGYQQVPRCFQNLGGHNDFLDIIENGTKKIGIVSMGDIANRLSQYLLDFNNANCQISICACRSRGATVQAVMQYPQHQFIPKTVLQINSTRQQQLTVNQQDADRIIALI